MKRPAFTLPKRWHRSVRVTAAVLLGVLGAGTVADESTEACTGLEPGPTRTVTRIIDGETVALDDGTELRLIGALAPRAFDVDAEPGVWPLEAGARETLRGLVLGKSIAIAFAGQRMDRYGRLQAHAFLIGGEGPRWVQGHLLERGLARAYGVSGNSACSEELLAAERPAREARRGLWAEAAYQVRRADKPSELLRYRTTFQIVEGTVVRVAEVRGTIYLNFARNWRRAFSASVRRNQRHLLGKHSARPTDLEGKVVRVRGWIEQRRRAPVVDLSVAGNLEVLGPSALPAGR